MAGFDLRAARSEGYTDAEILDFLQSKGEAGRFDVQGALKEGYSPTELVDHLAAPKNTSYTGALLKGASDIASGVGKTLKQFGGADGAAATAQNVAGKLSPGATYKSATETFMHPSEGDAGVGGLGWGALPRNGGRKRSRFGYRHCSRDDWSKGLGERREPRL